MSDLKDVIRDNASGPASAEADGVVVRQHKPQDQIAADVHLAKRNVSVRPSRAISLCKLIPPGTV